MSQLNSRAIHIQFLRKSCDLIQCNWYSVVNRTTRSVPSQLWPACEHEATMALDIETIAWFLEPTDLCMRLTDDMQDPPCDDIISVLEDFFAHCRDWFFLYKPQGIVHYCKRSQTTALHPPFDHHRNQHGKHNPWRGISIRAQLLWPIHQPTRTPCS